MVWKTSFSGLFRDVPITYELIQSILGAPVTDRGKYIGTIIGVNPEADTISIEMDDCYSEQLSTYVEGEFTVKP